MRHGDNRWKRRRRQETVPGPLGNKKKKTGRRGRQRGRNCLLWWPVMGSQTAEARETAGTTGRAAKRRQSRRRRRTTQQRERESGLRVQPRGGQDGTRAERRGRRGRGRGKRGRKKEEGNEEKRAPWHVPNAVMQKKKARARSHALQSLARAFLPGFPAGGPCLEETTAWPQAAPLLPPPERRSAWLSQPDASADALALTPNGTKWKNGKSVMLWAAAEVDVRQRRVPSPCSRGPVQRGSDGRAMQSPGWRPSCSCPCGGALRTGHRTCCAGDPATGRCVGLLAVGWPSACRRARWRGRQHNQTRGRPHSTATHAKAGIAAATGEEHTVSRWLFVMTKSCGGRLRPRKRP